MIDCHRKYIIRAIKDGIAKGYVELLVESIENGKREWISRYKVDILRNYRTRIVYANKLNIGDVIADGLRYETINRINANEIFFESGRRRYYDKECSVFLRKEVIK